MKVLFIIPVLILISTIACTNDKYKDTPEIPFYDHISSTQSGSIKIIKDPLVGWYKTNGSSDNNYWAKIFQSVQGNTYYFDKIDEACNVRIEKNGPDLIVPQQEFKIRRMSPGGAIYYLDKVISGSGKMVEKNVIELLLKINDVESDLVIERTDELYNCLFNMSDFSGESKILVQRQKNNLNYYHFHYMIYNQHMDMHTIIDNNCKDVCSLDVTKELSSQCDNQYIESWYQLLPL